MSKPTHAFVNQSGIGITASDFEEELRQAFSKVLPTDYDYYREVNVLAVHWGLCDPQWIQVENDLLRTFANDYNFKTETFVTQERWFNQCTTVSFSDHLCPSILRFPFPFSCIAIDRPMQP